MKFDQIQPRFLRYRRHYWIYILGLIFLNILVGSFWATKFLSQAGSVLHEVYRPELMASIFCAFCSLICGLWMYSRMKIVIQVYPDHLRIQKHKKTFEDISFEEIESVKPIFWSTFCVKTNKGKKFYLNASIDRVDYIWEGINSARPELIDPKVYNNFRVKLVQYDHHEKRKEWFFKHKVIDVLNWFFMPVLFLVLSYLYQTQQVVVHNPSLYFFRLFMYTMLVLLCISFFYSMILKKFVFDRKVQESSQLEFKLRDLDFEGVVLQRSKMYQFVTAIFILGLLVKMDLNLYSITKVKDDIASFSLKKGSSVLIDNRYNCTSCKYEIHDGDFIVFGKGIIGQVLAKEGDFVGQIAQDKKGRLMASENVQEVPKGHVAVKAANGKDIVFVKIEELIGKIQN